MTSGIKDMKVCILSFHIVNVKKELKELVRPVEIQIGWSGIY